MKYLIPSICILLITFFTIGCNKKQNPVDTTTERTYEMPNLTVERYIELLKKGNYTEQHYLLPAFSPEAIPALLTHTTNAQLIQKYPSNPISSFHQQEIPLGFFVLWTIENIRVNYAYEDRTSINNFPSLNPFVRNNKLDIFPVVDEESLNTMTNAYNSWWENKDGLSFEDLKQQNPLEATVFSW